MILLRRQIVSNEICARRRPLPECHSESRHMRGSSTLPTVPNRLHSVGVFGRGNRKLCRGGKSGPYDCTGNGWNVPGTLRDCEIFGRPGQTLPGTSFAPTSRRSQSRRERYFLACSMPVTLNEHTRPSSVCDQMFSYTHRISVDGGR